MRAAYTYNGLHQRASRRAAANTTIGLATNDLGNLYYYDSAWRLCEERAATHWDGAASFTPAKITQRFWCPLYIDALIATQTDTTGADPGPGADGDFTDAIFENTIYAACDRKYDVIAMTDADGILKERTDYSPYGVARHRPPADLNGDGKIDGVDQLIFFNAWGASLGSGVYNPDADINFDGQVNGDDFLILNNNFGATPAPPGAVSQHGNTVGYSGYIYDDAIGLSLARFRWYDAETGRWATRDPIKYATGSNSLYQYVQSSSLKYTDPLGLGEICRRPLAPRRVLLPLPGGRIIPVTVNPMLPWTRTPGLNPWNLEPHHEHVFFDDGTDDVGFFPRGLVPDDPNLRSQYTDCESFPNDAALRRAVANCSAKAPFCLGGAGYDLLRIGGENCQGFTACVRAEYGRLTNRREVCEVWGWKKDFGGGWMRECVKTKTVEEPWPCP